MTDEPVEQQFSINLPPEVAPGRYADFVSIWHTENIFVIDFVALAQPPQPSVDGATGKQQMLIPGQVVSRIRIPPQQVFEVAKALTQQLERWEEETGQKPPAAPFFADPDRESEGNNDNQ